MKPDQAVFPAQGWRSSSLEQGIQPWRSQATQGREGNGIYLFGLHQVRNNRYCCSAGCFDRVRVLNVKQGKEGKQDMKRQYKMVTTYYIYVNDRCFQKTEKEERKNELVTELLPQFYPGANIWYEAKRERRYC